MTAKQAITEQLEEFENAREITILYAAEAGSRAWGMASKDSDFDIRFIFSRPSACYAGVETPRDVIERSDNVDGYDLDFAGWDLRKTLNLFRKGNVALFEWLQSPTVYREDSWVELLRSLAKMYFQPKACVFHYYGLGYRNYKAYIANKAEVWRKKYLYVARSVLCCQYAWAYRMAPPVDFLELITAMRGRVEPKILDQIVDLIKLKKQGDELSRADPLRALNNWLEDKLKKVRQAAEEMEQPPKPSVGLLNQLLFAAPGT